MSERLTDEQIKSVWTWCMTGDGAEDVDQLILSMVAELQERRAADEEAMRWEYEERPKPHVDVDNDGKLIQFDGTFEFVEWSFWNPNRGPYLRNWRAALRAPEDKT